MLSRSCSGDMMSRTSQLQAVPLAAVSFSLYLRI